MNACRAVAALAAVAAVALLHGGDALADDVWRPPEPYAGYVYPAGGERGSMFRATVGGQNLRQVQGVHVSGEGVSARIVRYEGAARRVNGDMRIALAGRITWLRKKRRAELAGEPVPAPPVEKTNKDGTPLRRADLSRHPFFKVLDTLSVAELDVVESRFLRVDPRKQPNAQIAETVLVQVNVAPDAKPGDRDLRLITKGGLSNPVCFQVGTLPEVRDNDPVLVRRKAPAPLMLDLPVLVNGQIMPGDVDRYRLRAKAGQRLVIDAHARRLVPFLADAVPGWFQATLSLRGPSGRELAFVDDYRFDPDPVLMCEIPEDGSYELTINDAIYRGREDFVYRIAIGEQAFVTTMFPLGARTGKRMAAELDGWNLDATTLSMDTAENGVRTTTGEEAPNDLAYSVDAWPTTREAEPNDTPEDAAWLQLPRVVDGRIDRPGDEDSFRFRGGMGHEIVAEVLGRRLRSPLDSLLRLTDEEGHVVAWNDDHPDPNPGVLTHHADSYLRVKLPRAGEYRLTVSDVRRHGGQAYGYRLRVGPPRPDFALVVSPASITVPAGRAVPITLRVLRHDGFDGAVDVSLADAPEGFVLSGARVPAGKDSVRMTLSAPPGEFEAPVTIRLGGRGHINGKVALRPVLPADEVTQAFITPHLLPAQDVVVVVRKAGGKGARLDLPRRGHVHVPAGGTARVEARLSQRPAKLKDIRLELVDPPSGVRIDEVIVDRRDLVIVLGADDSLASGTEDNLIVEAIQTIERKGRNSAGEPTKVLRYVSLGYLPAIPIEIVRR